MTVSKAYGILKREGFIETNRRNGAKIAIDEKLLNQSYFQEKMEQELQLLITEATLSGYGSDELLETCKNIINKLTITSTEEGGILI